MGGLSGKPVTLRSALVVVLLLLSVMGAQAYFTYRAETQENLAVLNQSAGALDFHLTATLGAIDELLAETAERADPDHWPDPAVVSWLTGRLAAMPAADTLLLVGLDGKTIGPGLAAKQTFPGSWDIGDREYFRHHLAAPEDRGLHVGEPFISRLDHHFVIPVSRGVFDKQGRLRAVIRISVDPRRLIGDFAALMSGDSVSNVIFHETGDFIAGATPKDAEFTKLGEVQDLVRSAEGGDGVTTLDGNGPLRLVVYRAVPKYHLVILSSIRGKEAYAVWRREQLPAVGMLAVLSAAILGFAILFDRRERQHEVAIADHQRDLERLVAERTAQLAAENLTRAKTEEALRDSRRRLVGVTDSLLYSILVFTASGEVVFANLSARRMLGADEMEGLPLDDFLQIEEQGEPVPFLRSPLASVGGDGTPLTDNDAVLRIVRGGATLPVSYVCAPLADDSRRRNFVLSFRDITDIKRAQSDVLQASRLASVGQLASGIAHEINTPIQYIGNNLSFIADAVRQLLALFKSDAEGAASKVAFLSEELPAAISESLDGVAHIARIVLSMKEFSHPGSTAKTLVDLNRALDTTLTVTSNVWKHAAAIERDYDPALPQVPCLAGEMNQVFLNLIVNAVHAIEGSGKPLPGTIRIATRQKDGHAEVIIEDSGTGIPQAVREKIFDPFFTTKEVGKGTGQGLAICQDLIVVKHGGTIEVGGAEGVGAVFTIRLPLEELVSAQEAGLEGESA